MNGFDVIVQPDAEDADAAEVFVDGAIGGRSIPVPAGYGRGAKPRAL